MLTLYVGDLKITYRAVLIPDTCPECKADLRGEYAIKEWYYADEGRRGTYQEPAVVGGTGSVESDMDTSCGESFISIAYYCGDCDHPLAAHSEQRFDDSSALDQPTEGRKP